LASLLKWRRNEWRRGIAVVAGGIVLAAGTACAGGRQVGKAEAQEAARPAPAEARYDVALDSVARILAGLPPDDPSAFAHVVGGTPWQQYRGEFDRTWSHSEQGRFAEMRKWRDSEIGTAEAPFRRP
jgi:hypothetical protein